MQNAAGAQGGQSAQRDEQFERGAKVVARSAEGVQVAHRNNQRRPQGSQPHQAGLVLREIIIHNNKK